MNKPELSIIIPVYNGQSYIRRCVKSIMQQQDADKYEIIIVDDCSTDNTLKIANSIAQKYKNIRVIPHKKNAGVSGARNTGIAAATGKFVTFVDADDWVGADLSTISECFDEAQSFPIGKLNNFFLITPEPIELSVSHFDDKYFVNMLRIAYDTDADVVLGGRIAVSDKHIIRRYFYDSVIVRGTDTDDKCELLVEAGQREFANSALYSHDMLNAHDLRFMVNMDLDEDILFCMLALLYAKKVATAPDVTYFYDNHSGTLSNIRDDRICAAKTRLAQVKKYAVLLNTIAEEMSQYMNPKVFGYQIPLYTRHARTKNFDCLGYACVQNDCTNCPVTSDILAHCRENIQRYGLNRSGRM